MSCISHAFSRAHSILTLRMTHPLRQRPHSRLVIADLGGCERVAQVSRVYGVTFDFVGWCIAVQPNCCSGVSRWLQSGAINDAVRLSEAIHINLGLLALQVPFFPSSLS
jgi:hypothetical protein